MLGITATHVAETMEQVFEQMVDVDLNTDPIDIEDAMDAICDDNRFSQILHARSFEAAVVLTKDAGFVLTLADGSEFQITVVQSKGAF